ncbi:MAG: BglII/BstYI family type II restriction endonuclease [Candidatus Hodarchaeota archaeon]
MPRLIITDEFSHMGGGEYISQNYPHLKKEVIEIISTTTIPNKSKYSKEKGKKGRLVWQGSDFNKPLEKAFKNKNWEKLKHTLEHGWIESDFHKEKIVVEVQFGKYFSTDTDFIKYEIFHYEDKIDAAIEIIPCYGLHKEFYTGVPNFKTVVARIKGRGRNNPAVPIWVIGINVK